MTRMCFYEIHQKILSVSVFFALSVWYTGKDTLMFKR